MKLYTPFDFDNFSNTDAIENSTKLEYIKEMISLAQEDKKSVYPYVTISISSIVFTLSKFEKLLSNSKIFFEVSYYIGVIVLICASILYFSYWRKIHKCQIQMTGCLPTLNIEKTRDLWIALWEENKALFKSGLVLIIIGCFILFSISITLKILEPNGNQDKQMETQKVINVY